jgi:hypothetical protein
VYFQEGVLDPPATGQKEMYSGEIRGYGQLTTLSVRIWLIPLKGCVESLIATNAVYMPTPWGTPLNTRLAEVAGGCGKLNGQLFDCQPQL